MPAGCDARIGIDSNLFYTYTDPAQAAVAWEAVQRMVALGAQVVYVDVGDPLATFFDAEFTVLLHEFKIDVARYLTGVTNTSMRSLADLIAFNAHMADVGFIREAHRNILIVAQQLDDLLAQMEAYVPHKTIFQMKADDL